MRTLASAEQESVVTPRNHAAYLVRMARPVAALRALDGITERARHTGNRYVLALTLLTNASALIQLKQWDKADAALREAATLAAKGDRSTRARIESGRAELELARGNLRSAHQHNERALEIAGYHTDKTERALARILLVASQTALAERAPADAERYAREALALAEGMTRGSETSADVGEALLRLAQARALAGERAGTRPLLARAVRCLSNGLRSDHPLTLEARRVLANATG
jgi:tetratricopeptide (TPR) repeat protein